MEMRASPETSVNSTGTPSFSASSVGDVDIVADRIVLRIAEADRLAAERHADAHGAARADVVEHAGKRRNGRAGDERQRGKGSQNAFHGQFLSC